VAFISSAFTAGQTLTAASMEALRENSNAGHNVFTNEAARDAAITAPTEGMMAYLTAPTVPAATGATTAVPTGVTTIYNGSVWVCMSDVGAYTVTGATTTSGTYADPTGGGTNPTVTLVTGTTALVTLSAEILSPTLGTVAAISVGVTSSPTVTAADANFIYNLNTSYMMLGRTTVITGLTAGTNTFALKYKVGSGTGNYASRSLIVRGIA
jgi:hypothetical protein